MFRRVARAVASAEARFSGAVDAARYEEAFYRAMRDLAFLPNSPTLMNAGTEIGQLSACFVLPVDDSIEGIFGAVRNMAIIHQSGGGTGFSFSRLRPAGDVVRETGGVATGPVTFMEVFDKGTDVVKHGGRRRGANMGVLRVDHPDIMDFIVAKEGPGRLTNFNLSVAVTDEFMRRVERDERQELINPRTAGRVGELPARRIWRRICESAWRTGDPGLVFIDEINRHNPTPEVGEIETTNPCGEQPLLPYESCNLGSVNLSLMVRDGGVDWKRLRETVRLAVCFLDDVIEANRYPLSESEEISRANRKVGLGVMGFAELLIQLGIPYDSEEALALAERLMAFVDDEAHRASSALAAERGSFPNFERSIWPSRGYAGLRNATVTTVAPTGTIGIIAGTTSGIEPLFALAYERRILNGERLFEVNRFFQAALREAAAETLLGRVASTGTLEGAGAVPERLRRLFRTALDVAPEWHVRMQAVFQKHTDNAVSKTVNLPESATVDDVREVFELAHRLRCKGITVFRYGSRGEQVLNLGSIPAMERGERGVAVHPEYAGECRICSV
jgi:ribonucleoside-diphosphate reductase alpha chain